MKKETLEEVAERLNRFKDIEVPFIVDQDHIIDVANVEYKEGESKFNWLYLLNFVYFFLFISLGVLIMFLAGYFGGTISLICSAYPMLGCVQLAFLFLDWYDKYKTT